VIANPPYIQLQRAKNETQKYADLYKYQKFEVFDRTGDIYCLFYEKGIQLLKQKGLLTYITSNKWMRAGYGKSLREFFLKYNPLSLIDLGPGVFESATVDTNILIVQKAQNKRQLRAVTLQKEDRSDIHQELKQSGVLLTKLNSDAWFIGSDDEQKLKEKIERIGKPLKDWDVKIYYGIKTGLNEAFIITTEKRNEILANCKVTDASRIAGKTERERTEEIIKPILRGRDIKRYYYEWAGLWVIIIPAGWTNKVSPSSSMDYKKAEQFINQVYPSLMQHLKPFESKAKKRDYQGDYWWELRHCAYYPEFEKEKVVWGGVVTTKEFFKLRLSFLDKGVFINAPANFMIVDNFKYFLGYLNSYLNNWFYNNFIGTVLHKDGIRFYVDDMLKIPLPPITASNRRIVNQIEALVDKILGFKQQDPKTDTTHLEREIDELVYRLYDLTEEEIKIIEGGNS